MYFICILFLLTGVNQHDALLVVDEYNRRKPEIPTTTVTTVDVSEAKTTVKPTKDAATKVESTSTGKYVIISCLISVVQVMNRVKGAWGSVDGWRLLISLAEGICLLTNLMS